MRRSSIFRRVVSAVVLGGLLAVGQVSGAGLAAGATDQNRSNRHHSSWIDTDTDLTVYSSRFACARVRADRHHYDRYGDYDRYDYGRYDDGRYDDGRYDDGRYDDGRYDDGRYGDYHRYGDPRGTVTFYLVGYGSATTYLRDGRACVYLSRNLRDGVYKLVARYNGRFPFESSWDSEFFRVGHRYGHYDNGYDNRYDNRYDNGGYRY